jgi:CheY-like chemotaxis protein
VRLREWTDIVDDSIDGIGHIRAITADLCEFSGAGGEPTRTADVHRVIETACRMTAGMAREHIQFHTDLAPVPPVIGDHTRLVQVVTNLLTNAIQAIPEEGTSGPRGTIRISAYLQAGDVMISVEDSGRGVPAELRDRIFAPFVTTRTQGRGLGLGLALCADIVRRHGGDIACDPGPAGGARFTVRLVSDERPPERPPPAPPRHGPPQRLRVLLIDDEPGLLRAFRRILMPHHDVVLAASGEQALEIVSHDTAFDIVICDMSLPDGDGITIHEALKERDHELADRVVFFTGGPVTARARRFLEVTHHTVLEKPVPPEMLLGAIEQLGKRS